MSALTPAEVTDARADFATLLPDTCVIQRGTLASDGGGGLTARWADVARGLACRISPVGRATGGRSGIASGGGRLNDATTHFFTFVAGTDVRLEDRIVFDGVTYEVLLVRRRGNWELSRRVEVKEKP